jgi:hypothetical protein
MSGLNRNEYKQISRGFGNEFYINDASKVKVIQVLPIRKALKVVQYRDSKIPASEEELESFYNSVHDKFNTFAESQNIDDNISKQPEEEMVEPFGRSMPYV